MALEQGEDGDREQFDFLFRCLQAPERRRILFHLLQRDPREALLVPEDVHVGERELSDLAVALTHHHLPMLERAGLIRWDRDTDEVHEGTEFGQAQSLLEAISEHDPIVLDE